MIISFSHTTPALLAGAKTVTRRAWADRHAAKFEAGQIVDAWDRLPRVSGAHKVAEIRLTRATYREPLSEMPDGDYKAEGFAWLAAHGAQLGDVWDIVPARTFPSLRKLAGAPSREYFDLAKLSHTWLWVVRFELVRVVEAGG